MKCVNCGTDNNLKERTANQGRCKNCNHTFAFEPTSTDAKYKFTDPFFKKAITDISVNGTLSFTRKQFFYALERRVSKKNNQMRGGKGLGWFRSVPRIERLTFCISVVVGLAIIIIFFLSDPLVIVVFTIVLRQMCVCCSKYFSHLSSTALFMT